MAMQESEGEVRLVHIGTAATVAAAEAELGWLGFAPQASVMAETVVANDWQGCRLAVVNSRSGLRADAPRFAPLFAAS